MSATTQSPTPGRSNKKTDVKQVIRALEEYCATHSPGERLPTRAELVRQFDASERSVLRALDELERVGKIVRRQGAGIFVSDEKPSGPAHEPLVPFAPADSRTVMVIAKPDQSFFDRCVDLLFRYAEVADLTLLCRPFDPAGTASLTPSLTQSQPLGFILFRWDLAPLAKELQDAGQRVVLVGAPPADVTPEVPCVYGDHEQGGYLACRHLLDLGHRHIAFVSNRNLPRTLRWRGYQRALQEARRSSPEVRATTLFSEDIGVWYSEPERAAAYFKQSEAPTGMVMWNDHEAATLLTVLSRAGIKVPEDVSLVGYDALPEGRLVYPSVTTVDSAIGQQLQAALDLLTQPAPPSPSHTVVVVPTLVPRESSAAPTPSSGLPIVASHSG